MNGGIQSDGSDSEITGIKYYNSGIVSGTGETLGTGVYLAFNGANARGYYHDLVLVSPETKLTVGEFAIYKTENMTIL